MLRVADTSIILINQASWELIFLKGPLSGNEEFSIGKLIVQKCHGRAKNG
jgi:hypothetical protein